MALSHYKIKMKTNWLRSRYSMWTIQAECPIFLAQYLISQRRISKEMCCYKDF